MTISLKIYASLLSSRHSTDTVMPRSHYQAISSALGDVFESIEARAAAGRLSTDAQALPLDDRDVDAAHRTKIGVCILTVTGTMMAGGWAISTIQNWTFVQGLYWAFQTTTTVGYGDEVIDLTNNATMLFVGVYALVSVGVVGGAFTSMSTAKEEARAEKKRRALLRRRLDAGMIAGLDKTGRGVDRAEFVCGMLVAMGKLSNEDVSPLLR